MRPQVRTPADAGVRDAGREFHGTQASDRLRITMCRSAVDTGGAPSGPSGSHSRAKTSGVVRLSAVAGAGTPRLETSRACLVNAAAERHLRAHGSLTMW